MKWRISFHLPWLLDFTGSVDDSAVLRFSLVLAGSLGTFMEFLCPLAAVKAWGAFPALLCESAGWLILSFSFSWSSFLLLLLKLEAAKSESDESSFVSHSDSEFLEMTSLPKLWGVGLHKDLILHGESLFKTTTGCLIRLIMTFLPQRLASSSTLDTIGEGLFVAGQLSSSLSLWANSCAGAGVFAMRGQSQIKLFKHTQVWHAASIALHWLNKVHLTTICHTVVIIRICFFVLPAQQNIMFSHSCFTCHHRPENMRSKDNMSWAKNVNILAAVQSTGTTSLLNKRNQVDCFRII